MRHRGRPRLWVILPVYNEGRSIYRLLAAHARVLPGLDWDHELLVINDASQDDSQEWIDKGAADFGGLHIACHRHETNQGLHGALNTGLGLLGELKEQDCLVTMDGDHSHDPRLLPVMLAELEKGADLVVASRFRRGARVEGLSFLRRLLSLGALFFYQTRWRIPGVRDYTCLFRLYRGDLVRRFLRAHSPRFLREQGFTASSELLRKMAALGSRCVEVPMVLRYDLKQGASNLRILRTVYLTLRMLLRG